MCIKIRPAEVTDYKIIKAYDQFAGDSRFDMQRGELLVADLDENASNHLALGNAYKFSMEDGISMSDEAFSAAGGNQSLTHVDFMIGSSEKDIDGLTKDGLSKPILRDGEWVFEV